MVTCTGHIGIHEGADGRTYGRKMTSWLFYQIFSNLVPRVLGLLGQQVSARIDSGIID